MKSYIWIILSMILTCVSQILLKYSTTKKHESLLSVYLNLYVISSYIMLGISILVGVVAYTEMDYKYGPVFMSLNYFIIMIASRVIFNEKITRNKLIGNILIVVGVIIFALC